MLQFSHSVVPNSLWPHALQHTRLPCPSPTPGACSNSSPSSQWCHPTISSSVVPFSSCLQPFPASGSFPVSVLHSRWPKYWSFSFSISSSNGYSGLISFRIDWLCILQSKALSRVFSNTTVQKTSILWCSAFFIVQLSHPYMTAGKAIALSRWTFVSKVMSLIFNMLSRLVINFLSRSKCLLISWLKSPSGVIFKPPQNKVFHSFHGFPIYLPWSDGTRCHDLSFLNVVLSQLLSLSSRGSLVPLCFLPLGWCHLHIWDYWYFSL